MTTPFVDIHCHLLPGLDDGAADWHEALAMARLAADDGVGTVIATPHQLGAFSENCGGTVKQRAADLQHRLDAAGVPLQVLPGGELRIEPEMVSAILRGDGLTLGDHRRHVLVELPHDVYLPVEALLDALARHKLVAILAHPERNGGILREPAIVRRLVEAGCLMQVTAGSLCGTFGTRPQQLAERMLAEGLVHVVASDGHGVRSRRPLLSRSFEHITKLRGEREAVELCYDNPARVAAGEPVAPGRRRSTRPTGKRRWLVGRRAG